MKYLINSLCFFLLTISVLSQDNYYWVGGTGNWSDLNHWQLENGTTPISLPDEINSVIFNESSFVTENDFVNIDVLNAYCKNMIWENIPFAVWLSGSNTSLIHIYGSLKFHENVINEFFGKIWFDALIGDTGKTIEMNGATFRNSIYFIGVEGEWNLMDNLWMNNAALIENTGQVYLEYGSLNTNGHEIHCSSFHSNYTNVRTLIIENSTIHLYQQGETNGWEMDNENLNLLAEDSEIIIHEEQAKFFTTNGLTPQYGSLFLNGLGNKIENSGALYFQKIQVDGDFCELGANFASDSLIINGNYCSIGVGAEINNLVVNAEQFSFPEGMYIKRLISNDHIIISGSNYIEYGHFSGDVYFAGNNIFDTLILAPTSLPSILGSWFTFQAGTTQTINDSLYLRGHQCQNLTVRSSDLQELAYIRKDFGEHDVQCDFLHIHNVGALSESLNFYAGENSIVFPDPEDPPPGWIFENDSNYTFGFCGYSAEACWGDTIILDATCFNGDEETMYYWNFDTVPGEITYAVWEPQTVHVLVVYAENCYYVDNATIEFDSCENSIDNNYLDKLVKIFPNPSNGVINLETTKIVDEFELTICNSMGIILFRETIRPTNETTRKTYDFSYLETGIYYVRLEVKNRAFVRKIIIY